MTKWPELWIASLRLIQSRKPGRIFRAPVELYRRADTGPLRAAIEKILTNEPGSEKIHLWRASVTRLHCTIAMGRRRALRPCFPGSIPRVGLPQLGRDFWAGVVTRLKGDETAALAAFMGARAQQEEELRAHPDDTGLLAELGLIDAAWEEKKRR